MFLNLVKSFSNQSGVSDSTVIGLSLEGERKVRDFAWRHCPGCPV